MAGLTEEEKAELTEEELKAVEEGGDESEEGGSDAAGDEADQKTDQGADQADDQKTDQGADQEAGGEADQKTDQEVLLPPVPLIKPVPEEEIKRLEDALAEAKQKFDDGDISYEELSQAQRALDKAQFKNEIAIESTQEAAQAAWHYEQKRFWHQHQAWAQSPALSNAMVAMVNTMIEAGEDAPLTHEQLLQEAKRRVIADFEAASFKVAGSETKGKSAAELVREAKARGADRSNIPQDLREIPAADAPGDQDEFAWLDKLSGEAYERAVSKLTPEQLERYENAH